MTQLYRSSYKLVDALIAEIGKNLVVGVPIGVGQAVHVVDALFERAESDASMSLTIFTGLTLVAPDAGSGLAARFVGPLVDRLYSECPVPLYVSRVASNNLPANVQVREFYLRPGAYLGNVSAQQNYTSVNYSHVVDELMALGVNVVVQTVAASGEQKGKYSLASNPEITLDLLPQLRLRRKSGSPFAMVGQVNRNLPYMFGTSELDAADFDFLLDGEEYHHPLFGILNRRVKPADYATGMHVASLVPDGGTLQLGIGSLSDAVAHCLRLRHEAPEVFREVLARLPGGTSTRGRERLPVHDAPFTQGLYASTELLSDAIFSLFRHGLIKRPADADDETLVHAGFFVGSNALYEGLRTLPEKRRRLIDMTRISFVNTLYDDEQRKRRQRVKARFVNETMMATLLGAAVSDALDDGRVVSGVGGQFDFVAMAQSLAEAHSILMLPASRMHKGKAKSNIRWSYGHTTVPRHHRDIFVTQYGIAATRGRTDMQTIVEMLQIAGSAFQGDLVAEAKAAKKLPNNFGLAEEYRNNRPQVIEEVFSSDWVREHFPEYPLGTDLTPTEQTIVPALEWLSEKTDRTSGRIQTIAAALLSGADKYMDAMTRLGLESATGIGERLERRLMCYALKKTGT